MVCEIAKRVGKKIVVFKGEKKCSDNKREGASASSFFHEKSHQTVVFFEEVYRNSGSQALNKLSYIWELQA